MATHAHPALGARTRHVWAEHWTWLAIGAVAAFALPFVLADVLDLQRDVYYGAHAVAVLALVAAWLRTTGMAVRAVLARRWRLGVALGAVAIPLVVLAVLKAEESSARPDGLELAAAIVWRGLVYGAADGILLSVFPILVVYAALEPHRRRLVGKVAVGCAALAASMVITAVYHLGYPEFRGEKLSRPVAGSPLWSAPTLVTASPLGAPIAHAALHVTAVVESYDTDLFLPPHREAARNDSR